MKHWCEVPPTIIGFEPQLGDDGAGVCDDIGMGENDAFRPAGCPAGVIQLGRGIGIHLRKRDILLSVRSRRFQNERFGRGVHLAGEGVENGLP